MCSKRQRPELDLRGEGAPAANPDQLTLKAEKPGREAIDPGTAMTKPRTPYAGQGTGNGYLARGSHQCFSCALSLTRLDAAALSSDTSYAREGAIFMKKGESWGGGVCRRCLGRHRRREGFTCASLARLAVADRCQTGPSQTCYRH